MSPSPIVTIKQEPGVTSSPIKNPALVEPYAELSSALTEFTREKLSARFVLCVRELKEMFSTKLAELPPGHPLGAGVSDLLLERSLVDAGGVRLTAQNARNETLYAWRGNGTDEVNRLRDAVIEMLNVKPIVRITALRKKLGEDVVSDDALKKVLKDYCFTSGGSWHLKGTRI